MFLGLSDNKFKLHNVVATQQIIVSNARTVSADQK